MRVFLLAMGRAIVTFAAPKSIGASRLRV